MVKSRRARKALWSQARGARLVRPVRAIVGRAPASLLSRRDRAHAWPAALPLSHVGGIGQLLTRPVSSRCSDAHANNGIYRTSLGHYFAAVMTDLSRPTGIATTVTLTDCLLDSGPGRGEKNFPWSVHAARRSAVVDDARLVRRRFQPKEKPWLWRGGRASRGRGERLRYGSLRPPT